MCPIFVSASCGQKCKMEEAVKRIKMVHNLSLKKRKKEIEIEIEIPGRVFQ